MYLRANTASEGMLRVDDVMPHLASASSINPITFAEQPQFQVVALYFTHKIYSNTCGHDRPLENVAGAARTMVMSNGI